MKRILLSVLLISSLLCVGCKSEDLSKEYPQSQEFFREIQSVKDMTSKEERTKYIKKLQSLIDEKYPYDESLAKPDVAIRDDVEDMGIIERFVMYVDEDDNFSDELLYEASNNENMIKFSYHPNYEGYDESNAVMDFESMIDMTTITTNDKNLHNELCAKGDRELLLHQKAIQMMSIYNQSKNIDNQKLFKELKEMSMFYEEKNTYESTYAYKFESKDEILNVVYDKELDLVKSMGYFDKDDTDDHISYEVFNYDEERDFYRVTFMLSDVVEVEDKIKLFEKVMSK